MCSSDLSVEEMGSLLLLLLSVLSWMIRPPLKLRLIFKQMEFVGVKSIFVVVLTGTFTGMVMALQGYYGFRMFSAESLVGSTVALGMTRELGPVLTSLMVTARAGSAMAAELGTMNPSNGAAGKPSTTKPGAIRHGFVAIAEAVSDTVFRYYGDRPQRWTAATDVWFHGYWKHSWADQHLGASAIDTNARTVTLSQKHNYGMETGMPYYAEIGRAHV